jgi:hypothetical protein
LVFTFLRWWLSHSAALCAILTAAGHDVHLYGLAYRDWREPVHKFDLRQMREYQRQVMALAAPLFPYHDLSLARQGKLPAELSAAIEGQSKIDVQYTLQREDLDLNGASEHLRLFQLRNMRNGSVASALSEVLTRNDYDVAIIPNGSILEFGAAYQTMRFLHVPVVTFEFGEQRERIWIARDDQVMKHDTTSLWKAHAGRGLTQGQRGDLQKLYQARQKGKSWMNFARQWQSSATRGSAETRRNLGLEPDRPLVLLCTNVVGDSLTLGRQVFTKGMADWLERTARYFADRTDVQLVVRVHPGELLGAGQPSVDVIESALPELPGHVRVIPPGDEVNTYDLIELASLGLVYTTTVGMEMAMAGIPVIVAGQTHYRGKGFTYDPLSWTAYIEMLDDLLSRPDTARLTPEQIEEARRYAYLFFFKFARPYPYHIVHFWQDIQRQPMSRTLDPGVFRRYRPTLDAMVGGPISWA